MTADLGFSVEALVPAGRGGGALRMGLAPIAESAWRDPDFDHNARAAAFDRAPESIRILPGAEAATAEVAELRGARDFACAARSGWEDLCILEAGRLTAAAVGFPTDWRLNDKMGLPVAAIHAPIHGYADQLAAGVDHFMAALRPGPIYARSNWFVVAGDALRYLPEGDPATRFDHVTAANAGETLFVRCERQTLRRLSETSAILFAIGVYVAPLGSLSDDNVARIARAVATVPPGEAARRAAPYYAPALAAFAAERSRKEAA